jgi:hypothetical protein
MRIIASADGECVLGEHNLRSFIGSELGLSESDLAELKSSGVI